MSVCDPKKQKYCKNCGRGMEPEQLYCKNCGQKYKDNSGDGTPSLLERLSGGKPMASLAEDNDDEKKVTASEEKTPPKKQKYCKNCGRGMEPEQLYCKNCGQKYKDNSEDDAPSLLERLSGGKPMASLPTEEKQSPASTPTKKPDTKSLQYCHYCGWDMDIDQKFCHNCGKFYNGPKIHPGHEPVVKTYEPYDPYECSPGYENNLPLLERLSRSTPMASIPAEDKHGSVTRLVTKPKSSKYCHSCGWDMDENQNFCKNCGKPYVDPYAYAVPYQVMQGVPVPYQPVQNAIPNQPVQNTIPYQPVQNTIPYQPVQNTIPNQPVQNAIPNQPVQNAIPNQPVQNAIPNQPVQNTADAYLKVYCESCGKAMLIPSDSGTVEVTCPKCGYCFIYSK